MRRGWKGEQAEERESMKVEHGGASSRIRFRVPVALMTAILPPYAPLRSRAPPSRPCPLPTTENRTPPRGDAPLPRHTFPSPLAVQHTSRITRITSQHRERATCSPLSPNSLFVALPFSISPFFSLPSLSLSLSLLSLLFSQKGIYRFTSTKLTPPQPSLFPGAVGTQRQDDIPRYVALYISIPL